MKSKELDDAIANHLDECLSEAEASKLSAMLAESPEARKRFWETAAIHAQLEQALQHRSMEVVTGSQSARKREAFWMRYPTIWAAAACVVVTCLTTTLALAIISPGANRLTIRALPLGEAETGRLPSGFPIQFGVWSGDMAAVEPAPVGQGASRTFRFIRAEADPAEPNQQPNACDIFQVVDLRSAGLVPRASDDILELSARFRDERSEPGARVRFVCRLMLFEGDPKNVASGWPLSKGGASSLGTGDASSEGGVPGQWQMVTAKATIPEKANFAVLQILATKPAVAGHAAEFGQQVATDVRLTLRSSSAPPERPRTP
ncbi:MAG: hypothetical protein RLZZ142_680 [Verrucomicrobiota bacterium]